GKVTIDLQQTDIGRPLKKGEQILMYYDDDMDFDGNPGYSFLPEKLVESDAPRALEDDGMGECVDDVEKDDDYENTVNRRKKTRKGGANLKVGKKVRVVRKLKVIKMIARRSRQGVRKGAA
ncbi:hypothetical protein QFC22_006738, partial [Naganishia vaughanmartiniae]